MPVRPSHPTICCCRRHGCRSSSKWRRRRFSSAIRGGRQSRHHLIINERHHQRILGLIEDARDKGARIHELNLGHAEIPAGVRVIAPTLLYEVTDQMRVMQEEIFGPLLPIVTYDSLDQAIDYVKPASQALALYLFEEDDDRIRRVVNGTISGGVCVNDTMLHIAHQNLPLAASARAGWVPTMVSMVFVGSRTKGGALPGTLLRLHC